MATPFYTKKTPKSTDDRCVGATMMENYETNGWWKIMGNSLAEIVKELQYICIVGYDTMIKILWYDTLFIFIINDCINWISYKNIQSFYVLFHYFLIKSHVLAHG